MSQVALLEPKQDDPDQQQSQKAVEGMDRQFAVRPVIRRPPQAGTPALADAKHLFHLRLAPVGHHHALIAQLLTVGKEDGLAKVAMFDRAFLAPIPLPAQRLDRPVVQMERRRAKKSLSRSWRSARLISRLTACSVRGRWRATASWMVAWRVRSCWSALRWSRSSVRTCWR